MTKEFFEIKKAIDQADNILVVTHPLPDGDALGATCGLIGYLKSLKKFYKVFCADPVPQHYSFLPWHEEIENDYTRWPEFQPELIIFLDLPDWERSKIKVFIDRLPHHSFKLVTIDHHTGYFSPVDVKLIDSTYSSTSEILYDFYASIGYPLSLQVANALLTGLIYDTENFANPATSIKTLQVASELMHQGANFSKITQAIWRFRQFDDLRLIGLALNRLHYNEQFGIAVTVIKEEDLKELDLGDDPFSGFPNFLKGLSSGKAIMLLVEQQGKIKASLRSVDHRINVANLAQIFGGGGHRLAAGFVIPGELQPANSHWQVV